MAINHSHPHAVDDAGSGEGGEDEGGRPVELINLRGIESFFIGGGGCTAEILSPFDVVPGPHIINANDISVREQAMMTSSAWRWRRRKCPLATHFIIVGC